MTVGARTSLSLALVGSGGSGVMTAGGLLLDAAAEAGLKALMTRTLGPQIRGGEAAALIRLASGTIECADDSYDVLLAIDWKNAERFADEIPLRSDSVIVGEADAGAVPEAFTRSGARVVNLPLKSLAKEVKGGRPNMVALGAIAALIGLPLDSVITALENALERKGPEAIAASTSNARAGANFAQTVDFAYSVPPGAAGAVPRWSITGNQAAALGAVRGGVRFAAAYPITPATEVLEWLASALPKVGGMLVQAEDELASINMIIGASFGGTPSLTATSGPGLSLMMEALGLAVSSETPVVVLDVMRGGPSTGIPTKSEQSDLNIALYGFHGDAPHLVLAPTAISDCVFTTQWSVYLAEALQTAAVVLSDQAMGQARAIIDRPADVAFLGRRATVEAVDPAVGYKRYALTESGISPVALPGTPGGQHTADGLSHTETGTPSSQARDHQAQLDKRLKKLANFEFGDHWAVIEGDAEADLAVLTWGSTTGAVREALERARADGLKARMIAPRLLYPVQPERMAAALDGVKHIMTVELSHLGQFTRYLKSEYDLPCTVEAYNRPGPLPFRPGDIHERLMTWSRSHA